MGAASNLGAAPFHIWTAMPVRRYCPPQPHSSMRRQFMRRFVPLTLTAAALTLAACNKTDRDNIYNAGANAAAATRNGAGQAVSATQNFASRAGGAISNGAKETYRSFNEEPKSAPAANSSNP
jgi:hypothetical protein